MAKRSSHPAPRPAARKSLVRVLSRAGLCSRQQAVQLVAEGRVAVDGRPARDPERRIDERAAVVTVDGQPLVAARPVVVLLNKPTGYVTTLSDERGRATVYDLLGELPAFVSPVGRLDRDTSGLLLLTNDTLLADRLIDPRQHVPRVYRARCRGSLDAAALVALARGVQLDDGPTRPAEATVLERADERSDGSTLLELVLTEGRNRQVRRMLAVVGSRVQALQRVRLGPLSLGTLAEGHWRMLDAREVSALRSACGATPSRRKGGDGERETPQTRNHALGETPPARKHARGETTPARVRAHVHRARGPRPKR